MKRVMYFLTLSALLTFTMTSCGDDDGGVTCTQEEFLGTYTGEGVCTGAGGFVATSIEITAGTGSNDLIINGGIFTDQTATIDGCGFSWGSTTLGTGVTGSGSIDGNTLTYSEKAEALGTTTYECTFTGTK